MIPVKTLGLEGARVLGVMGLLQWPKSLARSLMARPIRPLWEFLEADGQG